MSHSRSSRLTRPARRRLATVLLVLVAAAGGLSLWVMPTSITWTQHPDAPQGLGQRARTSGLLGWITVRDGPVTFHGTTRPPGPTVPAYIRSIDLHPASLAGTLVATFGLVLGAVAIWRQVVHPRLPPDRCDHCGYDLRASAGDRCPECGAARAR